MINTSLHIKMANNSDEINICYKLREIVFINEQNVPVYRERDDEDNFSIHFLIFDKNIPIATARIFNDKGIAIIGRLCVLKKYRKKGIGILLMKEMIKYCEKQKFKKITLGSQEHAIGFYNKLGFKICSEKYIDANIPHFKMQLIIGEQNDL